jgi:membrane associated rhomboid family serine protease
LTAGLVPIVAGVIMLGWWGGGGGDLNVDVSAHVCGFGAGSLLGFLTVVIRDRRREAIVSPAPPR